jgi:hypothetical protein
VHTVTKILVVFAAVLCVLLAALTMAYSVNADRIVADYKAQVNAKLLAVETANADVSQANLEKEAKQQELSGKETQITELGMKIASLENDRAQLMNRVSAAETAREGKNAQVDQLAATSKTQALLIDSYRTEVTKLRDNELSYQRKQIELVDRLNDLESQREVQDQNIRALQEQLQEMRRTIDTMGPTGNGGPAVANGPYKPSIPISGKIVATQKAPNGKTVATINVGTNSQVRENMELAISRGGQFLGNFVVTRADLQWAVGEINTLGKNVDVHEGDSVSTLVSR